MSTDPIRVVIAVVGLDQHEVGSMVVSRILSDAGMEVVYLGRFQTPDSVVAAAISEDADVVGVSCHSWEFFHFVDELIEKLAPHSIPLVLGGSVVTASDTAELLEKGVAAVFGPSSSGPEIVEGVTRAVRG